MNAVEGVAHRTFIWIERLREKILSRPFVRHVGAITAANALGAALSFIQGILIARWLGPTEYGRVALIIAYPTLLWSFVGIKSVSVITRYVAVFRAQGKDNELTATVKAGYLLDLLVSLLAFILVAVTAPWVSASLYQQGDIGWIMVAYAASFPAFVLTGGSWAVLSAWERFRSLAIFEVARAVLKLGLVTVLVFAGFGASGAIIGMAVAQASIGLLMMANVTFLLAKEGKGFWWRASLKPIGSIRKELLSFFGWNYLLVTLSGLIAQIPVMLLGRFRGPEEAGFYRLATSIVTVGSYVESSMGRVAYPVFSARYGTTDRESLKRSLRNWTLRAGLPVGVLLVLVISVLPVLVPWVFGPKYRPMIPGAQVLLLSAAVSAVFFWLNSFYYACGGISLWVKGYAIYTLLVIGLSWVVIHDGGFLGLAWLVGMGEILFTLLMLALLKQVGVKAQ